MFSFLSDFNKYYYCPKLLTIQLIMGIQSQSVLKNGSFIVRQIS